MSEVKHTPEGIAKLSDKVAKGHYLTQSEAEYLLNAYDALRAQLTAAQVEIGGLRGAATIFQQAVWSDAAGRVTTCYQSEQLRETVSRNPALTMSGANEKLTQALRMTPNASAGERVRGVIEAARVLVDEASKHGAITTKTGVGLAEALAALKEVHGA